MEPRSETWRWILACSVLFGLPHDVHAGAAVPLGYLRRSSQTRGDLHLDLVERPGGPVCGRLVLSEAGGVSVTLAGKEHDLTHETADSGVIYDDRRYLKYYERADDFVRVLSHNGEKQRWLKLTACSPPLQTVTWIEDIVERGGGYLLYGYNNYRLRSAPHADAPVLIRIEAETRHVISHFTGKITGAWAEAVVVEIRGHLGDCWGDDDLAAVKTGRSWTGWIKVVGDNGLKGEIGHYGGC